MSNDLVLDPPVGARVVKNDAGNPPRESVQSSMTPGAARVGGPTLWFGQFRLDTVNERLWHQGIRIELTPKAFAVLRYLVERAGRLVTQQELLDALWPGVYVQPEILKTYVRDIRKVLGDDPRAPKFIETRVRRGYSFIATVRDGTGPARATPAPSSSRTRTVAGGVPATLADVLKRQALAQAFLWMALSQSLPELLANQRPHAEPSRSSVRGSQSRPPGKAEERTPARHRPGHMQMVWRDGHPTGTGRTTA